MLYPLSYGGMRESLAQDRSLANFADARLELRACDRRHARSPASELPKLTCHTGLSAYCEASSSPLPVTGWSGEVGDSGLSGSGSVSGSGSGPSEMTKVIVVPGAC